jgi:prevent-host-death family protein
LGERSDGIRKVVGSSPTSSTRPTTAVGANAFRDRFGYWMERAAAGEEILITRHGRRFARLSAADPSLDLATASEPPP